MKDWTVLSEARDPFRLDTPANHLWGRWLRDAFEQRNLPPPRAARSTTAGCTTG